METVRQPIIEAMKSKHDVPVAVDAKAASVREALGRWLRIASESVLLRNGPGNGDDAQEQSVCSEEPIRVLVVDDTAVHQPSRRKAPALA